MREASRPGPPRPARATSLSGWAACASARPPSWSAARSATPSDPSQLGLAACLGGFAIAAAVTQLRWCLVAVLFLLVAYVPDVLATRSAAHASDRDRPRRRRWWAGSRGASASPSHASCSPSARSCSRIVARHLRRERPRRRRRRDARPGQLRRVVALLMRAARHPRVAAARGVGGRRGRRPARGRSRSSSRSPRPSASSYGGFAGVLPDGDAMRSAGPLNPNPFGQVLATSAVLAFYLARIQTRALARDCSAAASRSPAWWAWSTPSRGRR